MQLFKKIFILAMVAVWSLAANHCKLEQLTGYEFLKCEEPAGIASHSGEDCQTDSCVTVESGFCKAEEIQFATPLLAGISLILICPEKLPLPAQNNLALHSAPAELPNCWQFVFRTASPPRAPSFVS